MTPLSTAYSTTCMEYFSGLNDLYTLLTLVTGIFNVLSVYLTYLAAVSKKKNKHSVARLSELIARIKWLTIKILVYLISAVNRLLAQRMPPNSCGPLKYGLNKFSKSFLWYLAPRR